MFNLINVSHKFLAGTTTDATDTTTVNGVRYPKIDVGFPIPSFDALLTFIIRFFFVGAGLLALLFLLLGALAWITSGGNKESVEKAREKIQAALIGVILIIAVLSIVGVIENILGLPLGITKPIVFPSLVTPN